MGKKEIPPRLRWQCRRGMLELDVLLGNFLEKAYADLSDDDKNIFEKLLACSDQDLFMWLTGKSECSDKELFLMVEKVRDHAKRSHKT
jgi:antitoxin CptB